MDEQLDDGAAWEKLRRLLIAATLVAILVWGATGHMDRALWHVGLNVNECGQNGYGALWCGDDYETYGNQLDHIAPGLQDELDSYAE